MKVLRCVPSVQYTNTVKYLDYPPTPIHMYNLYNCLSLYVSYMCSAMTIIAMNMCIISKQNFEVFCGLGSLVVIASEYLSEGRGFNSRFRPGALISQLLCKLFYMRHPSTIRHDVPPNININNIFGQELE